MQAEKAFKASTAVDGQGDGVTVPLSADGRPTRPKSISVIFAPDKPGPVKKVLTVKDGHAASRRP